jgi:hypothetical protein
MKNEKSLAMMFIGGLPLTMGYNLKVSGPNYRYAPEWHFTPELIGSSEKANLNDCVKSMHRRFECVMFVR